VPLQQPAFYPLGLSLVIPRHYPPRGTNLHYYSHEQPRVTQSTLGIATLHNVFRYPKAAHRVRSLLRASGRYPNIFLRGSSS
jgi:hypothetical protein